jgi:hypothetical protein
VIAPQKCLIFAWKSTTRIEIMGRARRLYRTVAHERPTDDPLQGVTVPVATAINPAVHEPSHLQQVYAELVSRLPVPDHAGGVHHEMPVLHTNEEYRAYTTARVAAWKASKDLTSEYSH